MGRFVASVVATLGIVVATAFAGVGAASADPVATVQLGQTVTIGGTPTNSASVAAGSSMLLALNYQCSGADCEGATITVPVPAGMNFSAPSLSADVVSWSASGNTVTLTMVNPLPAGSAGQVTMGLSVPNGITPDGATFSWQSTMSATNADDSLSPAVTIVSHAGNTTLVSLSKTSGGAVGQPAGYSLAVCTNGVSTPGYGVLATAAGSVLTATLPAGATFISANSGGTFTAGSGPGTDTVSWTIGALTGCASVALNLSYPSSDGSNSVAAAKVLSAIWTGMNPGESSTRTLGTGSYTTTLVPATLSINFDKWSYSTTSPTTGNVGYNFSVNNNGNMIVDTVTVHDDIPDQLQVTSIGGTSLSTTPGSLWIASRNGPDDIYGTYDDGELVKAADFSGVGVSFGLNVYGGTWPSGVAGLPSDDRVQAIEWHEFDVAPGMNGNLGWMNATVMETAVDGTPVNVGDIITNTANFSYTADSNTGSVNKTKLITVAPQIATVAVRTGGPGTLALGVTRATFSTSIATSGFNLPNPVLVMLLPQKLSYVSWSHAASTLPEPTMTEFDNWQGTGQTLLRWTFPTGTVLLKNAGYQVSVVTQLAPTAWGTLTVQGFGSSSSIATYCDSNFFGSGADTDDKDGDGDTTESLCKWNDGTSPAPQTTASVSLLGSGQYQTGDVAGTAYTAPGSNDSYLMSLNNTGTIQLRNGILIDVLPRPGDTKILSSTTRNPSTGTFPVILRAAPIVPTLTSAVTTYYSTVANPCKAELSYSPSGCNAPNWSTTAPSNLATVTAVKIDFGSNVLDPFTSWSVRLPVTSPTTGASEPDFASSNPSATQALNDEIAYNSAAFVATSVTSGSPLLPSESTPFALRVPSQAGLQGPAPSPSAQTSTGAGTATQTVSPTVSPLGNAYLIDGDGNHVLNITDPGVGAYTINAVTGVISFAPVLGYTGTPAGVSYGIQDAFGQTGRSTYVPTVIAPTLVAPAQATSTGVGTAQQWTSIAVPPYGGIALLGGTDPNTVTINGVGTYTLYPATGLITFDPVLGFDGPAPAVSYRITDAYGTTADSSYLPTVTAPAGPTASAIATTGSGTSAQHATVTLPTGSSVTLLDSTNSPASSVAVPGEGTWSVAGGVLTFTPLPGFTGVADPVGYRVTDAYGQTADSTATATVTLPAGPTSSPVTSPYVPGAPAQIVTLPIPDGGTISLLDSNGDPVQSLVVPGVGTYSVSVNSGLLGLVAVLSFVADPGFSGQPPSVQYRVADSYGQLTTNSYTPSDPPARAASSGDTLAFTGSDTSAPIVMAALMFGLGLALVARTRIARRRGSV
jgi:CshA-type fibril repeat protein